ncbi:transcriptional regulator [Burkholderia cenocepacia]
MDKLLSFLNQLDLGARADFCRRIGTTEGYLRKAISVGQRLGPELCVNIERESHLEVTRRDLRKQDYTKIWPELVEQTKGGA